MQCRQQCGACCIAPSISSPLPKMAKGKPAGVICPHLKSDYLCELFGQSDRPSVCSQLKPCLEMCGENREHAMHYLTELERETKP